MQKEGLATSGNAIAKGMRLAMGPHQVQDAEMLFFLLLPQRSLCFFFVPTTAPQPTIQNWS